MDIIRKQLKTAAELVVMVTVEAERQNIHTHVQVNSSPVYDWEANVLDEYQPQIDQIVRKLRDRYELSDLMTLNNNRVNVAIASISQFFVGERAYGHGQDQGRRPSGEGCSEGSSR
jgi:hypothetical protein